MMESTSCKRIKDFRQEGSSRTSGLAVSRNGLHRTTNFIFLLILIIVCCATRPASGQGTAIPISEADIQQIVDAHNFFRSQVEPVASNMRRIVWNAELAAVAQSYAETCMFGPNPDRANQAASFDTVGENRAFGRTTNYTVLIERGWFMQRINFDFESNMCLSPGACDEYTQLVWAETDVVGCGAANCPAVIGLPILPNAVVFVCNYGPEGNIAGQTPYAAGEVCSQCPDGMNQCVENLCTASATVTPPTTTEPATPTTTSEPETTTQTVATTTESPPTTSEPAPTTTALTTTEQPPASTSPSPPCPPTDPTTASTQRPTKPYIVTPSERPDRTRSRGRSKSRKSKSSKSSRSRSTKTSKSEKTSKSRSESKSEKTSRSKSTSSRSKSTSSRSSRTTKPKHGHRRTRHHRKHRRVNHRRGHSRS